MLVLKFLIPCPYSSVFITLIPKMQQNTAWSIFHTPHKMIKKNNLAGFLICCIFLRFSMAKDSPGLVFSHGFPVGERIVSALYQPRIRPKPPVKINKGGPRNMYSDI